jgi:hypothetical protein
LKAVKQSLSAVGQFERRIASAAKQSAEKVVIARPAPKGRLISKDLRYRFSDTLLQNPHTNQSFQDSSKIEIDFARLTARLKAAPYPFVLDHSSSVCRRRGKPRLYATFFRSL